MSGLDDSSGKEDVISADDSPAAAGKGKSKGRKGKAAASSDSSSGLGSSDDEPKPPPHPRGRRQSAGRRCGVVTSTDAIMKDLEEKYAQMEGMVDALDAGDTETRSPGDTALVRSLNAMEFINFLHVSDIPIEEYGKIETKTKPVVALWLELIFKKCTLERIPDPGDPLVQSWILSGGPSGPAEPRLKRTVQILFLEVETVVDSEKRFLLLKDSTVDDKTRRDLNQRPSVKMFADEEVEDAAWRCLVLSLNVPEKFCWQYFAITSSSFHTETKMSAGFPGIFTVYSIHVSHIRVKEPTAAALATFGLPAGTEFTCQLTKGMAGQTGSSKSWKWCCEEELQAAKAENAGKLDRRQIGRPSCWDLPIGSSSSSTSEADRDV